MTIFFERIFEDILIELDQNQFLSILLLSLTVSSILSIIQIKLNFLFKEFTLVQIKINEELKLLKDLEKRDKHLATNKIYKKYGYTPIYNIVNIIPFGISLIFLVPVYLFFNDFVFSTYFGLNFDEPFSIGYFNIGVILMTVISIILNYIDGSLTHQEKKINYFLYLIILILLYNTKLSLIFFWIIIQIVPYFLKPILVKFKFRIGKLFICLIPYFVISINSYYSFIISIIFLSMVNLVEFKILNKNFYIKQISYLLMVFIFYSSILFEFLMYVNDMLELGINISYRTSIAIILLFTTIYLLIKTKFFDIRPIILIFSIITLIGRINSLENYNFNSKEFYGVNKNAKPILLIFLDGFQSPEVLKKKYNYEGHNLLTEYLNSNGWISENKMSVNEILTWNSMVSTFNYNLSNDSTFNKIKYKSTLFKKDKNFILRNNQLIKDLKRKKLKLKSFGLTPFNYKFKSKDIEHLLGRKETFTSLDYYNPALAIFHNNRFIYSILSNSILNIVARLTFFLKARQETFEYFSDKYMNGYDFIYYHFHMPHAPYYFKGEFEPENLWSFETNDYLKFWDFTQKKMIQLLKTIDYQKYRIILASDHGDENWGGIYTTFASFHGFNKEDIEKVNSIHDLGILINSSYNVKK